MSVNEVLEDLFYGDDVESPTVSSVYMGDTALHLAVWQRRMDYVKVLVENGADVNAIGDLGFTPLHLAASRDDVEIATFLIESGASTETRNELGSTPLEEAKSKEMKRMMESFRQNWSRRY